MSCFDVCTMFSWDFQCIGLTNIIGFGIQTRVISDKGGMMWGS